MDNKPYNLKEKKNFFFSKNHLLLCSLLFFSVQLSVYCLSVDVKGTAKLIDIYQCGGVEELEGAKGGRGRGSGTVAKTTTTEQFLKN